MKTYEQLMTEASVYGLGRSFAKRQIKNKAVDTKNAIAAQGRKGKAGELANKLSSTANDAQKVKDNVQTAKTTGHIAKRQLAKRAPQTAAKASKFLKPATKLATKAANVASKVTKPVSKVLGSKVLGPAAVGTGIADLTFNNPKVRKAYQNYSPKKTFGFGPDK